MPAPPLLGLTAARLKEFFREPSAVFWTFGFPLIVTLALGIAFRTQGVPRTEVAVVETTGAPEISLALEQSPHLAVRRLSRAEAAADLRRGKVALAVVPAPAGGVIEYLFDNSRPESFAVRQTVDDVLQRAAGRVNPRPTRDETTDAPGARYVDWLVPGLLGLQLMQGGLWGLGWTVVNARQRKLLKRLAATPMHRRDYLLSLILGAVLFVPAQVAVLFVFARLAFGVEVYGSLIAVLVLSLLGDACFAGIGLLCAARAQNTETVNGLINLVALPLYVLSGVFFASTRFPAVLQPVIRVLPLTALNDALRHVVNDGASLFAQGFEVSVVAAWGLVTFTVALFTFRWT